MPDWITTFISDTEPMDVPESFRLWTAITIISGALERKVWTENRRGTLYPNFYTVLTGLPATGKGLMIGQARNYWLTTTGLNLGPDDVTRRSFLDSIGKAAKPSTNGTGMILSSCISMPIREFGVFFTDENLFHLISDLYDNLPKYDAPRSTTTSVNLDRPTLNILAGVTPDYLGDIFPEAAWGQGFTSRLMLIYGAEVVNPNLDFFQKPLNSNNKILSDDLQLIYGLNGEFLWDDDARNALNQWLRADMPPKPEHSRLVHYCGRRGAHIVKLSMISAVSYHHKLTVTLADFERARGWLLDIEPLMPEIFKAMRQKSDEQLVRDLYRHVYTEWASVVRNQRKPVKEASLWSFLQPQVTSERIARIIENAIRSGMIQQSAPGLYAPVIQE